MLVCVQGGRRRGVQEGQVPPDFADVEKGTEALNIQLNLLVVTPKIFCPSAASGMFVLDLQYTCAMCITAYLSKRSFE